MVFHLWCWFITFSGWWFGFFFSIIYGIILPTDYFSEGLKPPTNFIDGYDLDMTWICHDMSLTSQEGLCLLVHFYKCNVMEYNGM